MQSKWASICTSLLFCTCQTINSVRFVLNLVGWKDFYLRFFLKGLLILLRNDVGIYIHCVIFFNMLCFNLVFKKEPFLNPIHKVRLLKPIYQLFHHMMLLKLFKEEHNQQSHKKFVFYREENKQTIQNRTVLKLHAIQGYSQVLYLDA